MAATGFPCAVKTSRANGTGKQTPWPLLKGWCLVKDGSRAKGTMKIENLPNSPYEITARAVEYLDSPEVVKAEIDAAEQKVRELEGALANQCTELEGRQADARRLMQQVAVVTQAKNAENRRLLEEIALCPAADLNAIAPMLAQNRNVLNVAYEAERLLKFDLLPTQAVEVKHAEADCAQAKEQLARLRLLDCQVEFLALAKPLICAQGPTELGLSPKAQYFMDALVRATRNAREMQADFITANTALHQLKQDAARMAL